MTEAELAAAIDAAKPHDLTRAAAAIGVTVPRLKNMASSPANLAPWVARTLAETLSSDTTTTTHRTPRRGRRR
jgi:hypothetical protein